MAPHRAPACSWTEWAHSRDRDPRSPRLYGDVDQVRSGVFTLRNAPGLAFSLTTPRYASSPWRRELGPAVADLVAGAWRDSWRAPRASGCPSPRHIATVSDDALAERGVRPLLM
jgi:hypothetical protein